MASESSHGPFPFPSPERLVRILGSIVEPFARLLALGIANHIHCGAIRTKAISHNNLWATVSFHRFAHELQSCLAIPSFGDEGLQDFSFVINSSPKVVRFTIDPHKNLVQVPASLNPVLMTDHSLLPDLGCENGPKPVPPEANGLMADVDATLMQ
jgi:hypothetical protein